jgi:flagellar motor switch protein FliM
MSEALYQKDVDSLLKRTRSGGKVTSDSLTQREIDAILQKTTPVPLAPMVTEEVLPYNFSRPPRVSKDRRANLESIYQRYALAIQGLLSSMLRTPIDVVVNSVEQAMFSEFVLSLGRPCATYVFSIGDRLGGEGAIDLSTDLAYHLVDRLFGGPGDPMGLNRPLTPLEQGVVRSFAERSLGALRDAWSDHLAFAPEVRSFESNPEMLQITSREDNVLVTNLEVRSTSFQGFLSICLPMASLEGFLQDKGAGRTQAARTTDAEAESQRRLAALAIQHAHVQASARLPQLWLSARVLADLRPGQVLQTSQPADAPIELHLNGRLRFHGSLGQVRRHLGLRIAERVHRPESERPARTRQGRVM